MKKDSMGLGQLGVKPSSLFGGLMNFFNRLVVKPHRTGDKKYLSIDDFEIIEGNQVSGISPESKLLEGARDGRFEWVKELIAQGANIDFSDEVGNTALIEAVRSGNEEIVKLLLDHDADVYAKTIGGRNALAIARENDFIIIQTLLKSKMGMADGMRDAFLARPYI